MTGGERRLATALHVTERLADKGRLDGRGGEGLWARDARHHEKGGPHAPCFAKGNVRVEAVPDHDATRQHDALLLLQRLEQQSVWLPDHDRGTARTDLDGPHDGPGTGVESPVARVAHRIRVGGNEMRIGGIPLRVCVVLCVFVCVCACVCVRVCMRGNEMRIGGVPERQARFQKLIVIVVEVLCSRARLCVYVCVCCGCGCGCVGVCVRACVYMCVRVRVPNQRRQPRCHHRPSGRGL